MWIDGPAGAVCKTVTPAEHVEVLVNAVCGDHWVHRLRFGCQHRARRPSGARASPEPSAVARTARCDPRATTTNTRHPDPWRPAPSRGGSPFRDPVGQLGAPPIRYRGLREQTEVRRRAVLHDLGDDMIRATDVLGARRHGPIVRPRDRSWPDPTRRRPSRPPPRSRRCCRSPPPHRSDTGRDKGSVQVVTAR